MSHKCPLSALWHLLAVPSSAFPLLGHFLASAAIGHLNPVLPPLVAPKERLCYVIPLCKTLQHFSLSSLNDNQGPGPFKRKKHPWQLACDMPNTTRTGSQSSQTTEWLTIPLSQLIEKILPGMMLVTVRCFCPLDKMIKRPITESPLLLIALQMEHFLRTLCTFLRCSLEPPSKILHPFLSPSQLSITERLHGPSAAGSLLLQQVK